MQISIYTVYLYLPKLQYKGNIIIEYYYYKNEFMHNQINDYILSLYFTASQLLHRRSAWLMIEHLFSKKDITFFCVLAIAMTRKRKNAWKYLYNKYLLYVYLRCHKCCYVAAVPGLPHSVLLVYSYASFSLMNGEGCIIDRVLYLYF